MSSLLSKPTVQHHHSRVSPVQPRDFPLHQWGNLTVKDPTQQGSSLFPRRRLHISPTANGPVPSLSGHEIAYRWRSLPRVRRRRANSPRGSSSNGCCLFRFHRGPIFVRLSFPEPLLVCSRPFVMKKLSEAV